MKFPQISEWAAKIYAMNLPRPRGLRPRGVRPFSLRDSREAAIAMELIPEEARKVSIRHLSRIVRHIKLGVAKAKRLYARRSKTLPSPQPSTPGGEGVKKELIREIRGIYRERRYRSYGRPLEDYGEEQLREHLAKLKAGGYPWMQRKRPGETPGPARETAVFHG